MRAEEGFKARTTCSTPKLGLYFDFTGRIGATSLSELKLEICFASQEGAFEIRVVKKT